MKYTSLLTTILIFSFGMATLGQSPDMYPPTVPEPVENPLLYIGLTIAVIVIYLLFRHSQNKKRKKESQNKK